MQESAHSQARLVRAAGGKSRPQAEAVQYVQSLVRSQHQTGWDMLEYNIVQIKGAVRSFYLLVDCCGRTCTILKSLSILQAADTADQCSTSSIERLFDETS